MKQPDNVVSFEDAKQDSISRRILLRKLQPLLKELTTSHMQRVMQGMFDNADDTLFKMSESATEGSDKSLYLDSMRIVRLQRKSIEKIFFEKLDINFEDYEKEKSSMSAHGTGIEAVQDFGSLELMEDADLEIHLAAENLIQKICSAYGPDLSAIEKRLSYLHGQDDFDPKLIPFGAESIVRSYVKATEMIDLGLEVQLILLKLFDLHCIHNLSGLYTSINELFVSENVLPVIKHGIVRQESSHSPQRHTNTLAGQNEEPSGFPGSATYPSGQLTSPLWGELQQMLNRQRHSGFTPAGATGNAGGGGESMSGYPGTATGTGQSSVPMSSDDVLASLSELQSLAVNQLPQGGAHAVGNFLRVHLESAAQQGEQ
ncbi:MAG: DUF1631 family protein, partial [Thioalkalispiraceae bacterium]